MPGALPPWVDPDSSKASARDGGTLCGLSGLWASHLKSGRQCPPWEVLAWPRERVCVIGREVGTSPRKPSIPSSFSPALVPSQPFG